MKSDSLDLRALLASWPYDPENAVCVARGVDGRPIMQVRTPLGIEQYELDGRPDGRHPHDMESVLDFQHARLAAMRSPKSVSGQDGDLKASFRLSADECAELFEESVLYYYRYLHLFQIQDWARTVRDTKRNLELFEFIHRYARRKEDRLHLEQWRPYVLRMNAMARAMLELEASAHGRALEILHETIAQIEALPELDNQTHEVERERSLESLRETAANIEKNRPLSEREQLERELSKAVEMEKFERAAELRDRIRVLGDHGRLS
jgi:hypothetical protein